MGNIAQQQTLIQSLVNEELVHDAPGAVHFHKLERIQEPPTTVKDDGRSDIAESMNRKDLPIGELKRRIIGDDLLIDELTHAPPQCYCVSNFSVVPCTATHSCADPHHDSTLGLSSARWRAVPRRRFKNLSPSPTDVE